jgi:hypothetical protein
MKCVLLIKGIHTGIARLMSRSSPRSTRGIFCHRATGSWTVNTSSDVQFLRRSLVSSADKFRRARRNRGHALLKAGAAQPRILFLFRPWSGDDRNEPRAGDRE